MALRVGCKRARELSPRRRRAEPEPMVVDESAELLLLREDSGVDADREDTLDDDEEMAVAETFYSNGGGGDVAMEQPRRKRAMVIRANIQFLQKLPPLANYQRGQFGRRGGVDGGSPDGDLGMLALEETMSDSGFSVPVRAAVAVAPAPVASSSSNSSGGGGDGSSLNVIRHPAHQHQPHHQIHHQHQRQHQHIHNRQHPHVHQVLNARRNVTPAFASRPHQQPHEFVRFHHRSGPVAWASSASKDDEARPATNDTRLW